MESVPVENNMIKTSEGMPEEPTGSSRENESVYGSISFDPQLFINDVLNAVDDCLDEGFDSYKKQAPSFLSLKDPEALEELSKAVNDLQAFVQKKVDKQLSIWERYCLECCFKVPEGISFSKQSKLKIIADESVHEDEPLDEDLDKQLQSLREKLADLGRESDEIQKELLMLESQRAKKGRVAKALTEVFHPLEEKYISDVVKELGKTGQELCEKSKSLKVERTAKLEASRLQMMKGPHIRSRKVNMDALRTSLDDLQVFVNILKN